MNQLFLNATGMKNGANVIQSPATESQHGQATGNLVGYQEEKHRIPHSFQVHTYGIPTVCQYCKKLLRGLFKQGVQCRDCQYNAHKKCLDKVPQDCTGERPVFVPNESVYHTAGASFISANLTKEPHAENDHFFREEFDDSDLDETASTIPDETLMKPQNDTNNKQPSAANHRDSSFPSPMDIELNPGEQQIKDDIFTISQCLNGVNVNEQRIAIGQAVPVEKIRSPERSVSVCPQASNNIPLMRIVQSVKHTKRRQGQSIKEGWLVHYTNVDKMVKRYYWRLDAKSITLFVSEEGSKYHKEIQLADIQSIEMNINPCLNGNYCFELRTNNVVYYIGQDPLVGVKEEHAVRLPPPESGIGSDIAKGWETSIKQAFMHVSNTRKYRTKWQLKFHRSDDDSFFYWCRLECCKSEENVQDMGQLYQIFPEEVLGSGQFGVVYGGVHKKTKAKVAIKVIDKLRFPTKQEAQLKNEVAILQVIP